MKPKDCPLFGMVQVISEGPYYLCVGEIRHIPSRDNCFGIRFPNSACAAEPTQDLDVQIVPHLPEIVGETEPITARARVQRHEKLRAAYVRVSEARRLGKGRHEEAARKALTQLEAIRLGCTDAWLWNNATLPEIAKHLGV